MPGKLLGLGVIEGVGFDFTSCLVWFEKVGWWYRDYYVWFFVVQDRRVKSGVGVEKFQWLGRFA